MRVGLISMSRCNVEVNAATPNWQYERVNAPILVEGRAFASPHTCRNPVTYEIPSRVYEPGRAVPFGCRAIHHAEAAPPLADRSSSRTVRQLPSKNRARFCNFLFSH